MEFHLTATGCHLPYGITQCYLPPDTSERAPPSPQPVGRNSIYLPRRDGRLSWPRLPGNAPAGNRTRDLSITSPTPYHCTNRATHIYVNTIHICKCSVKCTHKILYTVLAKHAAKQTDNSKLLFSTLNVWLRLLAWCTIQQCIVHLEIVICPTDTLMRTQVRCVTDTSQHTVYTRA